VRDRLSAHGFQKLQRPTDIHVIITAGMRRGLAHQRKSGKMDDRRRLRLPQRRRQRVAVADVAFDQRAEARETPVAGGKIVEDDGLEAGLGQCLAAMAADIAGAPGDENAVHRAWLSSVPPHSDPAGITSRLSRIRGGHALLTLSGGRNEQRCVAPCRLAVARTKRSAIREPSYPDAAESPAALR
jgi:hypothetical protein